VKVDRDEFEQLVREALETLPEAFLPYMENLTVDVEEIPTPADCQAVGIANPNRLLGLYHGTPVTKRSVHHSMHLPDRITIYQNNIQRMCRTRREIVRQVSKTVLHEIGHHFGLDENDLDRLGYG
jgi:predicted Zn-dependent protease with MMP-like domain